jgi:hypothetical protein
MSKYHVPLPSSKANILDVDGNIDTTKLSKELTEALEFDVRYKQVDNMKKRAIRNAQSYDEFKALVQCAHLKKLNRKEVESLSDPKRGWKKTPKGISAANSLVLDNTDYETANQIETTKLLAISKKNFPKNSLELEKNLRRLTSDSERWR